YRKGYGTEQRLASSEQRFRDYAEVASDWLWEMDAELNFSFISERFGQVSGMPVAVLLSKRQFSSEAGVSIAEDWRREIEDLIAHREFRDYRYRFVRSDGRTRFWSISGKPVYGDGGKFMGYRGTGTDVTLEVEASEALQHAKVQAEIANHTKSQFLANM